MDHSKCPWALIALLALAAPARAGTTVEAIWRVQQLQFDYYSPSVACSCRALQERIRGILHAVGAHESIKVDAGCGGDELVRSARARIALAAPVEAADAKPSPADIERFPASWRRISLRSLHLTRGDCDLLDGLRRQVFPRLRIRAATGFQCPAGPSRLAPVPRVEALVRTRATRIRDLGELLADSPGARR